VSFRRRECSDPQCHERELHGRHSEPREHRCPSNWLIGKATSWTTVESLLGQGARKTSIHAFLHRERDRLFPDRDFTDLFVHKGRNSVPPSVVAVVMVLQRLEGLSDREAVERSTFDSRWRYAAGVGGYHTEAWMIFSHTVLVHMRERPRHSKGPNRVLEVALGATREARLIGRRRVLDSTPLCDAVATMDTVTSSARRSGGC